MKYLKILLVIMITRTSFSQDLSYGALFLDGQEIEKESTLSFDKSSGVKTFLVKSEGVVDLKLTILNTINEDDDLDGDMFVSLVDDNYNGYILFFNESYGYCSLTTVHTNRTIEFYNKY